MQFFSPHDLSEVLGLTTQEGIVQLVQNIQEHLKQNAVRSIKVYGQDFEAEEVLDFLMGLQGESLVFIDWVRLHPGIKKALTLGDFTTLRIDTVIREHSLFSAFKKFLTPFLKEKLKRALSESLATEDWQRVSELLAYTALLVEKSILEVEYEVVSTIQSRIESLSLKVESVDSERRLMNTLTLLYNPQFYACLNALEKENYAIKLLPLELFQKLLEHAYMTPQLAKNILSHIQSLELNPHHKKKVDEFSLALRTGKIEFKKERRRARMNKVQQWQRLIVALLVLCVVCITFGFYIHDAKVITPEVTHFQSGFDSISKDQMAMLDSLYQPKALEEETIESISESELYGTPVFITGDSTAYASIKNLKARNLKHDLLLDYNLQDFLETRNVFVANCAELDDLNAFQLNHLPLNTDSMHKGSHSFQNRTYSDVYMVVFEDKKEGEITGIYVPENKEVDLNLKEGDLVFFYSGQSMSPFNPNDTKNRGYGSRTYRQMLKGSLDHHFCNFSAVNRNLLMHTYRVGPTPETGKSVLHRMKGGELKLVSTSLTKLD